MADRYRRLVITLEDTKGLCATCKKHPARFVASRKNEAWPVCMSCQSQGLRLRADVRYQAMPQPAHPSGY
jgi:hypothetical protein